MGRNKLTQQQDNLANLEALLYAAGRPLGLTRIVTLLKLDNENEVRSLLSVLTDAYEAGNSAIEIQYLPEERVVLQLKPDFTKQAGRFSLKPLLTAGPLKTLSFIAYHQPIEQKEVARARGSQAYKHLKLLDGMGLIKRDKEGRTTTIRTTQDFADAIGLSKDRRSMRRQLRGIFKKLELDQMEKK